MSSATAPESKDDVRIGLVDGEEDIVEAFDAVCAAFGR
jgi:hypothetical protein